LYSIIVFHHTLDTELWLVAWLSVKTSVSGWQTFSDLCLIYDWHVGSG